MNTVIRPTAFSAMPVRVKSQPQVRFGGPRPLSGFYYELPVYQPNNKKPKEQESKKSNLLGFFLAAVSLIVAIGGASGSLMITSIYKYHKKYECFDKQVEQCVQEAKLRVQCDNLNASSSDNKSGKQ